MKFEMPAIEVVKFAVEDVITVSATETESTLPAMVPPCG